MPMGHTHMLGGAAAWLAVCAVAKAAPLAVVDGTGLAVCGGLAVDIDHTRSDAAQFARAAGGLILLGGGLALLVTRATAGAPGLARYWPLLLAGGAVLASLSWMVRPRCGKHRGIVHSKWGVGFAVLFSFGPCVFTPWPLWAACAVLTGWLSHLVLDAWSKEGLPLNWPDMSRWGWLPRDWSMTTGGTAKRKGRNVRGKRRRRRWIESGAEYTVMQPALAVVAVAALWMIVRGIRP